MKKRDPKKQARLQKVTAKRAQYEKMRKAKRVIRTDADARKKD